MKEDKVGVGDLGAITGDQTVGYGAFVVDEGLAVAGSIVEQRCSKELVPEENSLGVGVGGRVQAGEVEAFVEVERDACGVGDVVDGGFEVDAGWCVEVRALTCGVECRTERICLDNERVVERKRPVVVGPDG